MQVVTAALIKVIAVISYSEDSASQQWSKLSCISKSKTEGKMLRKLDCFLTRGYLNELSYVLKGKNVN